MSNLPPTAVPTSTTPVFQPPNTDAAADVAAFTAPRNPTAMPVIPGPDFPIPKAPAITEGDPAQFVGSGGTMQQVKDAATKAALEATQTAIAIAKNNHLAELLKDEVFSDAYYEILAQRDLHTHLSDANLNPNSTPWHRELHGALADKFRALVDVLQEFPA